MYIAQPNIFRTGFGSLNLTILCHFVCDRVEFKPQVLEALQAISTFTTLRSKYSGRNGISAPSRKMRFYESI